MLFTDTFFLFYFLPAALVLLRLLAYDRKLNYFFRFGIIGLTLVFYAYENWLWPLLFLVIIFGIYGFAYFISGAVTQGRKKTLLAGAVFWGVGALILFKYLNWICESVHLLAPLKHFLSEYYGNGKNITLPPGISFYIFEAISFCIDAYKKKNDSRQNFINYMTFIAMFPRFIAGPIVRYTDVESSFREWKGMETARGLTIFSTGFAIKVLLADQASVFTDYAFSAAVPNPDLIQAWLGAVAFSIQLYLDFWGYSIMATGLGVCLGFAFPDNFQSPYHAKSIGEFWRRWHMTLSNWLRDYLYIVLGGNRGGEMRTLLNLLLTMTIAGIWHGASLTFLIWGAYYGVWLIIERLIGNYRIEKIPPLIRSAYTLMVVLVGWVMFKSSSWEQARQVYRGMLGQNGAHRFSPEFIFKHWPAFILLIVSVAFIAFFEGRIIRRGLISSQTFTTRQSLLIWAVFLLALCFNASSREIPFLYFQF